MLFRSQGSEEVEVSSPFDALVRAGSKVTLAKAPINADDAKDLQVTFNNGMKVVADEKIDDAAKKDWDLIVVPGGIPGTENLAKCTVLIDMLKKQKAAGKWISAICAAPAYVLTPNGLLAGEKATGYPSTQGMLPATNYIAVSFPSTTVHISVSAHFLMEANKTIF